MFEGWTDKDIEDGIRSGHISRSDGNAELSGRWAFRRARMNGAVPPVPTPVEVFGE